LEWRIFEECLQSYLACSSPNIVIKTIGWLSFTL
jgi:hypothetical protein